MIFDIDMPLWYNELLEKIPLYRMRGNWCGPS